MNPKDYLTSDEQSHDTKIAGRLQDISVEITQLAARDSLNDTEERLFEQLTVEFDDLEAQHKKLHKDARSRYIAKAATAGGQVYRGDAPDSDPFGEPDSIETRTFKDPWNLDEMRAYPHDSTGREAELRARALSAIEALPGVNDQRRKGMTNIIEEHPELAEMALVTSNPHYVRYWAKRLRHGQDYTPTPEEAGAVTRAMSLTDAEGGFLVPFQLDPTVIITSDGSVNEIRQAARSVIATGDTWHGVSAGAVVWSWDAEATEASDDAPTSAQPTIPVHKAVGFVPISIEALQDEQNVTTEIGRLLAFGKDTLEAAAFATGTGTGQPTGIVTALTGTGSEVASAGADTFAIGDVYGLHDALPARYRARSSWLGNNTIYSLVRQFDTAGGAGLWERIGGARPRQLLDRPVYESEDMDGTITAAAENYVLVIGDFDDYVIADRIGMTVETIPHLFATANNRPSGQRGFYAYYRVGADSVNDGAFRMLNVT